jgi:oligopeptide/dipeptide ABC transporter ATP-binding protein
MLSATDCATPLMRADEPGAHLVNQDTAAPLLEARGLRKHFPARGGRLVRAVEDVSFTIAPGEVLGLVGESGSGKTTVGRMLLRLTDPTAGEIRFDGKDLLTLGRSEMRAARRDIQMIFQDPFASLNPTMTVGAILGEGLAIHAIVRRSQRDDRVAALLAQVGMPAEAMGRYPHEFSGGQRQRIGIARALSVEPRLVVADEPVSALDVSVQAQVINLLQDLREQLRLSMLFIAHDLAVVEHVADRVMVMYLGRVMEVASSRELYARPRHPYTAALLSAVPVPDPLARQQRIVLGGDIPSPLAPPSGCVFRTRCPHALPLCAAEVPLLTEIAPGHAKACIRDDVA